MFVDYEYGQMFNEIGIENKENQKIVLQYIFNIARLGIESVNNMHKNSISDEYRK